MFLTKFTGFSNLLWTNTNVALVGVSFHLFWIHCFYVKVVWTVYSFFMLWVQHMLL